MAGLFNRLKTWIQGEDLFNTDLNSEFDNIISNIDPTKMSGYSSSSSQMQIQTNPGSQGSESLATTESGEIERLRFALSRLVGQTFWYDTPVLSISDINSLISQGNLTPPSNRIVSGKTRSTSNQPAFLVAGGSTAKVTLKGASTPFVYRIAGTQYTISSDVDLTFGSFSSGNTTTVNDGTLAGGASTATQGEGSTVLTLTDATFSSAIGTNQFGAFKMGSSEYFIGYVNNSTTITKCFRGYFFDSTSTPVIRSVVNNGDTVTVLKLFWIFATTGGTLDQSSNSPTVSLATPSSPSSGDYWYDLGSNLWKKYNGSSFVASNATLIGFAVVDTSHCIATRSFEFYGAYDSKNTCQLEVQDNNTVRTTQRGQLANVAGNLINFQKSLARWVKPTNLDTGETDGNNKTFYVYLKDTGDVSLSTVIPYDRISDLQGFYHPYNPWRALGSVLNDGSSHFISLPAQYNDATQFGLKINYPSIADQIGQAMTSAGANSIGSAISASGAANNIANLRTRATGATVLAGGIGISTSSSTYSNNNNSFADVTNLSVTITTTGRPVMLLLQDDGSLSNSELAVTGTGSANMTIAFVRGSTQLNQMVIALSIGAGATSDTIGITSNCLYVDAVAAGAYTYKVQALSSLSNTYQIQRLKLVAVEL